MRRRWTVALLVVAAGALFTACWNSCPFANIDRISVGGTVACCGASAWRDVQVPAEPKLEIDVSNVRIPGSSDRVDAWLTPTSCTQLFDAPYPDAAGRPPTPRCQVFLGPVAPGSVSGHQSASAGTYRVWFQAWSTNANAVEFLGDVGVWGQSCHAPYERR